MWSQKNLKYWSGSRSLIWKSSEWGIVSFCYLYLWFCTTDKMWMKWTDYEKLNLYSISFKYRKTLKKNSIHVFIEQAYCWCIALVWLISVFFVTSALFFLYFYHLNSYTATTCTKKRRYSKKPKNKNPKPKTSNVHNCSL